MKRSLAFRYRNTQQIIKNLIDQQIQYILNLKTINIVIKNRLIQLSLISQQENQYIFGEFQSIICSHESLITHLQGQLKQKQFQCFSNGIKNFIDYLQVYNVYILHSSKIFDWLYKFLQIYPNLFSEYQLKKSLSDYFALPLTQLLSYKQIFKNYEQILEQGPSRQTALQYYQKYQLTVSRIKNLIPGQKLDNQIFQKLVSKSFCSLFKGNTFKIQKQFEVSRLSIQSCLTFLVTQHNSDGVTKLFVLFFSKKQPVEKSEPIDFIEYGENSSVVSRPSGFHYRHRLLIIGVNKSVCIFFKKAIDKEVFASLIEVTRTISQFPKIGIEFLLYQSKVYDLYLEFTVQSRTIHNNKYYAIKLKLYAYFDFSEILYLTWEQILQILEYFKKVQHLSFPKNFKESNNKLEKWFVGSQKNQYQSEQAKCIWIQEILNWLVRTQVVRRRPQYLFMKLGVSENVWVLASSNNDQMLECLKQNSHISKSQKLSQKFSILSQKEMPMIPESSILVEKYLFSQTNPFQWIINAQFMYSRQYKQQRLVTCKGYIQRKTILGETVNIKEKILNHRAIFKEINQSMNPKIIQLSYHIFLSIRVYSVSMGVIEYKISHRYVEDKIQTVIDELKQILKTDKLVQFGLYANKEDTLFYFDSSEKISSLLKDGFHQFQLRRMLILPTQTQKQLYDSQECAEIHIEMTIGEIIDKIKRKQIQLNYDDTVSYLALLLSMYNRDLQLKDNSFNEMRIKYLPKIQEIDIQFQRQVLNEMRISRKHNFLQCYLQFMEIFVKNESWVTKYFLCKIWVVVEMGKNATHHRQYFSAFDFELGVNHKMLSFRYQSPALKDIATKGLQQNSQYIPRELSHSDYILDVSGQTITIRVTTTECANRQIYLICQNSLQIWRLVNIYKTIFGDPHL